MQLLVFYTQKRVKGKRKKKETNVLCFPPITRLICPLISPNLRLVFLSFLSISFAPPYCTHLDSRGQLPPGGMQLCRKRLIHRSKCNSYCIRTEHSTLTLEHLHVSVFRCF